MKKTVKLVITVLLVMIVIVILIINKDSIMKWFYKIEYSEYVDKYSQKFHVDKYLIYATIKAESNFDKNAKSNKDAKGLMQLMDSTGKEIAKSIDMKIDNSDLYDPEINIKLGAKYISKLLQKYQSIGLALAAYNAGSGKVDSWIAQGTIKKDGSDIENIPFKETNNYVRKILKNYKIYRDLYM